MSKVLKPEEVRERFGNLFCRKFITMVDEENGIARIIDECIAKGPVEWDAVNRKRAGGVITDVRVEGTTLIMDAVIGEREVKFGPASKDLGGQGLKALKVEGDKVKTTWVGLAGASIGVGACLPQASGTIETEYPDNIKVGGAHRIEVTITTPKMIRMIYAVDDTDTKEKGASWAMMLKMANSSRIGHFLEHKIIQLNPNVPDKTTNCVSVGVSFAVEEKNADKLTEYVINYVKENTYSKNTTLAVFRGLKIPDELVRYGLEAKKHILTVDRAREVAEKNGVRLVEITGKRGSIGAVAGIGCFDLGIISASLPEDFEKKPD
jgi:methanogenesis imperfect marker protein 11